MEKYEEGIPYLIAVAVNDRTANGGFIKYTDIQKAGTGGARRSSCAVWKWGSIARGNTKEMRVLPNRESKSSGELKGEE